MKISRLRAVCLLAALAPLAAGAAEAQGGCTGIQDQLVTPALFQRCLSAHPGRTPPGTGDPSPPLQVASAAQASASPGPAPGNGGDALAPKGLKTVKLTPAGKTAQEKPAPAALPAGEAPYPMPGLADAPLRFIDLKPVHFAFDKADLSDEAKQTLARIAAYLQQQKGLTRVVVIGYADHSGTESHNFALSEQRSKVVQTYLAAQGLPPAVLHTMARGNRMPVDESWTPSGRERNRRVEMYAVVR